MINHLVVNKGSTLERNTFSEFDEPYGRDKIEVTTQPNYHDHIDIRIKCPGLGFTLTPDAAARLRNLLDLALVPFNK